MGYEIEWHSTCEIISYSASYEPYPGAPDDPADGVMDPGLTFMVSGHCVDAWWDTERRFDHFGVCDGGAFRAVEVVDRLAR